MSKIKLALLGCGDVAHRDYLPEFHRIADRAELVAVSGRTEERARAVAATYDIPSFYTDFRHMLAECSLDAVINLTPIQLHAETTLAALRAGKHVYCEKPIAGSVAAARNLKDEAHRCGLTLVCAPCVMVFPQVRYVHELLKQGAIGAVHSMSGHGHGGVPPWSGYMSDPSQFFAAGAGPAMDMGVYPLHAITGLFGPARRVTAMTARAQRSFTVQDGPFEGKRVPVETDDNWQVLLDLGAARLAVVSATNVVADTRAPSLEIHGLQGTIALELLDVSASVDVMRSGQGWESISVPHERQRGPDHLLGVEHLLDCIGRDEEPVLSIDHAIHVVEIFEAANHSAKSGQTQELTTTF